MSETLYPDPVVAAIMRAIEEKLKASNAQTDSKATGRR